MGNSLAQTTLPLFSAQKNRYYLKGAQEAARKRTRRLSEHLRGLEREPEDLRAAEALMSLGEADEVGSAWPPQQLPSRIRPTAHAGPQARPAV